MEETPEALELNTLWKRIIDCFNDVDEVGSKVDHQKNQTGSRHRFERSCETKQAVSKGLLDTLKISEIMEAFSVARLIPQMSETELRKVFKAIEVFQDDERGVVYWRQILKATVNRDRCSLKGIFPIIVSLPP